MTDAVAALREGRAFADLSGRRKVLVRGDDAVAWLNDLLTAEMTGMGRGAARRTLLLGPTGRMRADLWAAPLPDGVLLLQDPEQPAPIDALLAPYVLSSDVDLADRTGELALVSFPGGSPVQVPGAEALRPSVLGVGVDLLAPPAEREALRAAAGVLVEAGPGDLEVWRVQRGVPRFGVDLGPDSLPHEVPLDHAIAFDKGCYLGQEAVAKVRNLGHPPFVVTAAAVDGPAASGDPVLADGAQVGTVTSAAPGEAGGTAMIVRVRWAARERPLSLPDGSAVRSRPSAAA